MLLLLDRLRLAFQKRFGKKNPSGRSFAAWSAKGYEKAPRATIVIQSHNKSLQVMHVVEKLRRAERVEIIVVDDGSSFPHTERLAKKLTGASEFLLRANDLYENITYNRAIRMAAAPYVCLMQDDDDIFSTDFIDQALALFEAHPDLLFLGGKQGFEVEFLEGDGREHSLEENLSLPLEQLQRGKAGALFDGDRLTESDPATGIPFRYVEAVNRAPMWLNRALFLEHVKEIPFDFAPFQYDDYEVSLRAWTLGFSVGLYGARFCSLAAGGMRLWNGAFTQEQMRRNGPQLYRLYRDKIDAIRRRVEEKNREIFGK